MRISSWLFWVGSFSSMALAADGFDLPYGRCALLPGPEAVQQIVVCNPSELLRGWYNELSACRRRCYDRYQSCREGCGSSRECLNECADRFHECDARCE